MTELALSAERAGAPPETPVTGLREDCDPQCEWKEACGSLEQKRHARVAKLPRAAFMDNPDDIRLTEQGHEEYQTIQDDFTGLGTLLAAAESCSSPCGVRDSAMSEVELSFGPAIKKAINELG